MAKINFYLLFNGNCVEACNFYKSAFGVDRSVSRGLGDVYKRQYGDIPPQNGMPPISEDEKNKIENICLPIAEETVLMGADVCGYMAQNTVFGNNFSLYIEADSRGEADRLFAGLSTEGRVTMPMSEAHWGDYFGMFTDKFGVNWLINVRKNIG